MATTAESIADVIRWVGRFARVVLRRAAITGAVIGLFAVAVWWTTRETFSDCSGVTAEQTAQLESLRQPSDDRSFQASAGPECTKGVYGAPIAVAADDRMESVTERLLDDRLELGYEFLPLYRNEWRRCFRFGAEGWGRIELYVRADRAGRVFAVDAVATSSSGSGCST